MKTLFTLIMPLIVIASGFAGFILFQHAEYLASAFFIAASHLSGAYWIYRMTNRKTVFG